MTKETGNLGDLGRFAEPSLLILVSLSDRPKHGYAIMDDLEAISGTRVGPGPSMPRWPALESRGLIELLPPEERRRPYKLTGLGATTLKAQLEGLEGFARIGLRRLAGDT